MICLGGYVLLVKTFWQLVLGVCIACQNACDLYFGVCLIFSGMP